MVAKAARRYASALLQIAIEQDILEGIMADVRLVHETIEASRDLELFLRSPIIKPEEKKEALHSVFSDSVQPLTLQFFDLVIRKGRERLLDQMMSGFIELYKEYKQILDVQVRFAMDLDDAQAGDLKKMLEKQTGKTIELQLEKQPELIGGMAIQIRDTIIDGTVRHQLSRLSSLFKEVAI